MFLLMFERLQLAAHPLPLVYKLKKKTFFLVRYIKILYTKHHQPPTAVENGEAKDQGSVQRNKQSASKKTLMILFTTVSGRHFLIFNFQ